METLAQIYQRHSAPAEDYHGDKGTGHSYIPVYEKILEPYRAGCTLMEIGIACGLSLAMWREYMPSSTIVGVDVSLAFDATSHLASGTKIIIQDATKPEIVGKLEGLKFDVVIDDASHMSQDQIATFNLIRPLMNPGGIYIIEDILSLELTRDTFLKLHPNCEILDFRKSGFWADVMIVYRF